MLRQRSKRKSPPAVVRRSEPDQGVGGDPTTGDTLGLPNVGRSRSHSVECTSAQRLPTRSSADRKRGAEANCRILRDREGDPRPQRGGPAALCGSGRARRWPTPPRRSLRANITVERSIRGIKLSRNSALFAGSVGGTEHWTVVASWSRPASLTTSIRLSISPTSDQHGRGIPTATSYSFCPGPTAPMSSRPWPETRPALGRQVAAEIGGQRFELSPQLLSQSPRIGATLNHPGIQ
ncbi:hypothetical protein ABIF16_009245 [Bradyrhizobium elkanii]